jgi:GGDEF domain-containing protein
LRVTEKMRAAIEALVVPSGGLQLDVGASFGVVHLDASLPDAAAVMPAADAACYAAKRGGRYGVRVREPSNSVNRT